MPHEPPRIPGTPDEERLSGVPSPLEQAIQSTQQLNPLALAQQRAAGVNVPEQGGGGLGSILNFLKDPRFLKAIGAFGSGFVGQGPQFIQNQRLRQQQELDREAAERQESRQAEQDVFTRNQQIAKAKREQSVEERATVKGNLDNLFKQFQINDKAFASAKSKLERKAISAARQDKSLNIEELGPGIQAVFTQDDADNFLASAKSDLLQTGMSNKTAKLELEKLTTDTALKNLELKRELSQSGLSQENILNALSLSTKYEQASKSFFLVRDAFNRVQAASENPTAISDIALVFGFMNLIDPSSTVREGEAATVEQSRGVPDSIRNIYNRLVTGERMVPQQRFNITNEADKLFTIAQRQQEQTNQEFTERANTIGAPVHLVVRDLSAVGRKLIAVAAEKDPEVQVGDIFKNPETGERVRWNGEKWVKVQ